jgi:diphthamide synthase subunit DPH2
VVCDVHELYRQLVDDFLIQYGHQRTLNDFPLKLEVLSRNKKSESVYQIDKRTGDLMNELAT